MINVLSMFWNTIKNLVVSEEWAGTRIQTFFGGILGSVHVPTLLNSTSASPILDDILTIAQIIAILFTIGNIVWKARNERKNKEKTNTP